MGSIADDSCKPANRTSDEPIRIAIIGGGLALGILNQAPHVRIHIYEAASRFAEIGAGVAFGINAQRALWKLDRRLGERYSQLRTSNVDFNVNSSAANERDRQKETYLRLVMGMDHATNPNFEAGKEIREVFCEGGFSSVHRARFLDQLVALLPEHVRMNCVTFGARLVAIEEKTDENGFSGVKMIFDDERTSVADAVIGCEGIRSQLRRIMLGDGSQPTFTGKYAYRGLIPMDKAVAALGDRSARNGHHRVGYGGHVLTFPIDKGETMNVVAFRTKEDGEWPANSEWTKPATKEEMLSDFEGWGDEVHAILNMMVTCDIWALFDHPPAHTYHREGKLCLIGDAAHASTPHQGSGAGMAVEDAFLMSGLLGQVREKDELGKIFATFEAMRKRRTQDLVWKSREQAAIYDFQAPGVGDDVEKIAQIVPHRWDWIWDHDVEKELNEAKSLMDRS